MKKPLLLILFLIVLLGIFFRFYKLGDYPSSLHRDEAFLGYNAYSILKTGRDMSGKFFPLHLQSFIYSPAGYSYLSTPFIKIFGLSAFSVRFASAFFGSATIILTFFLSMQFFIKYRYKIWISLIAAFLIAISPWHINLSRTATENTVVVFFIALGMMFYLLWIKRDKLQLLIASFIFFAITFFIYQAPRAFSPMFVLLLLILLPKEKVNKKRRISLALLFFTCILLPLILIFSAKNLSLRIRTVSIFATSETQLVLDQQIREDGVAGTRNFITRVFHNKVIGYSSQFLDNYFKHFSYDFLFTDKGLPDRYRVPLNGLLYIFELPLLVFGVWCLLRDNKKVGLFLTGWIMIVPIGSALTFDDVPNLQRTLLVFPALSIISAYGLIGLKETVGRRIILRKILIGISTIIVLFSVGSYLHQYYRHMPWYRPWYRQDGYRELVWKVNKLLPQYQKAIITDRESAPTIFFLFFDKYDPLLFQKEKQRNMYDYDRINFGKYEFSQEECPARIEKDKYGLKLVGEKRILYVDSGLCNVYTDPIRTLATIKRADNSIVFRILDVQ